jgi:hypothetical protein
MMRASVVGKYMLAGTMSRDISLIKLLTSHERF